MEKQLIQTSLKQSLLKNINHSTELQFQLLSDSTSQFPGDSRRDSAEMWKGKKRNVAFLNRKTDKKSTLVTSHTNQLTKIHFPLKNKKRKGK